MRILSKISIISFFLLSIFYLLPSVAHANTTTQTHSASSGQANYPVANTNPDVPPRNPVTTGNVVGTFQPQADYVPNNLHNWTQNVMIEVMSALTCQLAGVDPINPKQGCLGIDSASGKIGFLPSPQTGGAIGFMGNMIATLYTPPLHTSDYFQNLAQNFGINKKAYAQSAGGTGFQGLSPLIGIWSAFRNIVYLFLVIVFVVIGLAIMLRIKIDPRTVMSIQNQIPKIIIGILVVTFSFAIAGFLIDLMWVFIYLIINIISSTDPKISSEVAKIAQSTNPFQAAGNSFGIGSMLGHSSGAVANITGGLFDNTVGRILIAGIFAVLGGFIGHLLPLAVPIAGPLAVLAPVINVLLSAVGTKSVLTVAISAIFGATGGLLAPWIAQGIGFFIGFIVIAIALLFALFRLWFTLIMAYVHILLDVVLAPFWIISGIVPGSPISLSGWLRDISANLLAFPVTIAMFMLGKVFMDAFGECSPNLSAADLAACKAALANHFVPPLIGNPGDSSVIGSLIGLGIILMTPNVVNMLKAALKAPKLDTGGGLKALGVGVAVPGTAVKQTVGSIFAATQGTMPPPEERGFAAVLRRTFGRI